MNEKSFNMKTNQYGSPFDLEKAYNDVSVASKNVDSVISKIDSGKVDLDDIRKTLMSVSDTLNDAYSEIPYEPDNVEDWKDLVIGLLPNGASVAMANDVEAALENIKSVY